MNNGPETIEEHNLERLVRAAWPGRGASMPADAAAYTALLGRLVSANADTQPFPSLALGLTLSGAVGFVGVVAVATVMARGGGPWFWASHLSLGGGPGFDLPYLMAAVLVLANALGVTVGVPAVVWSRRRHGR